MELKGIAQRARKRDRDRTNQARLYQCNRAKIIAALGGKCVRCGFDDSRALQVDHIHGGGNQDRKTQMAHVRLLRAVNELGASKYQLLCANCNLIKRHENGEHRKADE